MLERYCIDHKGGYDPKRFDPGDTGAFHDKKQAEAAMQENLAEIHRLQQRLYADKKEGVIFLFPAIDAAGTDGTIPGVLSCLSPHGVREAAFKSPSADELAHDFLWRIEREVPAKGEIAIFNRSHYEDVLIGRVHRLYETQPHAARIDPDDILEHRYEDICNWEKYLYHNSVRMVKIFLNLSYQEQAARFLARIEDPEKNWKFSTADINERKYWADYQAALAEAINRTAAKHCPWYVVPADHKWYMRWLVSEIIVHTLREMAPQWPVLPAGEKKNLDDLAPLLREQCGKKGRNKAGGAPQ